MESRLVSRRSLLAVAGLCCMLGCTGSHASGPAPKGDVFGAGFDRVPASPRARQLERQMFQRVNQDRAKEGKPPLAYDERLADIARAHSADMRDHRFFKHESPTTGTLDDRLARAGYLMRKARENLAEGTDVDKAQEGLLASAHHHENMMATDVTHVGIGIVEGGLADAKNFMFTQVFADPAPPESVDEGRRAVVRAIDAARRERGLPAVSQHPRLTELAEQKLSDLPDEPRERDLKRIGQAINAELAKQPIKGLGGVAMSGQVLPDSSEFEPGPLLKPDVRQYGLAAGKARGPSGRPMLKVLIVIGL